MEWKEIPVSDFTKSYQDMITVHGWNGTAATMGMKRSSLEARVYELNGHGMRVDTAMMVQAYSGTTLFAQAVAAASGGVFIALPQPARWMALSWKASSMSCTPRSAICRGNIVPPSRTARSMPESAPDWSELKARCTRR